jgi:hypothetical protein
MVAHALPMATICTAVHKSPSLTVAESWLSTAFSTVMPTVPKTICFQVRPRSSGSEIHCAGVLLALRQCLPAYHPLRTFKLTHHPPPP